MTADPLPVLEAIQTRHSVRAFKGALSPEKKAIVSQAIVDALALPRPFGTDASIVDHPPGLGRLGFIVDDAGWLLGTFPESVTDPRLHYFDIGFILQQAVIRLAQYGIGTVWIAGTWSSGTAERATPGFKVPVGVAYGEAGGRPGVMLRIMGWFSTSKSRRPFAQLFYDGDNSRPFTEETAGDRLELLRVVQSGPSAMNGQPWRLLLAANAVHVYNAGSMAMCGFDIGIALAGIDLYAKAVGKAARFDVAADPPVSPLGGAYVVTVTINDT
jgi:nitroreductase